MSGSTESEMKLGLSRPLREAVQQKFVQARAAGDLLFSDTELSILHNRQNVPFQLRFCPALAKKPTDKKPSSDQSKPKPDPFANPSKELLIDEIPQDHPSHILVLNKYPVISNHFILATKANKPQTDLLDEKDLQITYACIKAWQEGSNHQHSRLFAFFNSGEHSGASQVHRHLQFLPVEDMKVGSQSEDDWQPLIDSMKNRAHPSVPLYRNPDLSFVHFATPLEKSISSRSLYAKYIMLMKAAFSATELQEDHSTDPPYNDGAQIEEAGKTRFSYNLALTSDGMAICPRKAEAAPVPGLDDGSSVAINGTILGGTLMVKDLKEWNTLRENPHILDDILQTIAYPRTSTPDTKL